MTINNSTGYKKVTSKSFYKLGFIGLIPNFGLISGFVLLVLGFTRKDHILKILGLGGILFTPLFWYIFENSDFQKKNLIQFTNIRLNEIVKDLEFYKNKNGHFPDSLAQLEPQNKFFFDGEYFIKEYSFEKPKYPKIYYKKLENDYILKSKGPDMILNTKDDIYPELKIKR